MSGSGTESALRGPTLLNVSLKSPLLGSAAFGCALAGSWFGFVAAFLPVCVLDCSVRGGSVLAWLRMSCWRALWMRGMMLLYVARSSGMCLIASP